MSKVGYAFPLNSKKTSREFFVPVFKFIFVLNEVGSVFLMGKKWARFRMEERGE